MEKKSFTKQRVLKTLKVSAIMIATTLIFLYLLGGTAYAQGLVDETINESFQYSQYSLDHYQLDFYVDSGWGWLPWNWLDSIGKQVMYGLYCITDFIWKISLLISNATGYLVKEAYSLDFVGKTANAIGRNIQTLAGVTKNGFSSEGFYVGFLLLFIFILGIYVTYVGLIKRETTKAVKAVVNFVVVFILSSSLIAYAPDYVAKVNDFSSDVSSTALNLGTKITMPDSETQGRDSVDLIRESLFGIQVKNPWLLLQYGTSDIESIGVDRVNSLLSLDPNTKGGDREDVVIKEIEEHENMNLSVTKTVSRLGTVVFLLIFNIGISLFVFMLTGIMIFSQVLFMIYAMFLPIGFLLSMIPTYEGMGKKAVVKLFNTIMTRAGITLIITVAFSISSMLYSIAGDTPFFFIAFLQIVTFAGIYFKLGELMSMFSLDGNDSKGMASRIMRTPRMFMYRNTRRLQRTMHEALGGGKKKKRHKSASTEPHTTGTEDRPNKTQSKNGDKKSRGNQTDNHNQQSNANSNSPNIGKKVGEKVGKIVDTPNKVTDKLDRTKEKIQNLPTNVKHNALKKRQRVAENIKDLKNTSRATVEAKQEERKQAKTHRQKSMIVKRGDLERAKEQRAERKEQKKNADLNVHINQWERKRDKKK